MGLFEDITMSVQVRWYDAAQKILAYEFSGSVVWNDYLAALSRGRVMMQTVSHQVCVLNLMVANVTLPDGFVTKVRTIMETEPDNRGCVVYVRPPLSFILTMDKIQRIIPRFDEYCFYADTEEEGLMHIRQWNSMQAATS
jgi:hypothetical protein